MKVKQGKRSPKRPTLKQIKNHPKVLRNAVLALVLTLIGLVTYIKVYPYTYVAQRQRQLEQTIHQTQLDKKKLLEEVNKKGSLTEQQKKQIEDLNKIIQQKDQELQSKAASKKAYAAATTVAPLPSNKAKAFIYEHESGNRTTAVNSIGCRGLGQACPGSKLPCGDDYACQDAWFTNYMQQRYGSWENAYIFWVNNHWW